MHKVYTFSRLLLAACSLIACSGGDDGTDIALYQPDSMRQTRALESSVLRVEISVNNGAAQTFTVAPNVLQPVVSITGINEGSENVVTILWVEVPGNGERDIVFASQSQTFIATGNVVIDAPHVYDVYDYDGDGSSNYQELSEETCVWGTQEDCYNNQVSTELLTNGTFDSNDSGWTGVGDDFYGLDGELCLTAPETAALSFESYFIYLPSIQLQGGSDYQINLDIKADSNSTAVAGLNQREDGEFIGIVNEQITVSTNYEPWSFRFGVASDWTDVLFVVNLGSGQRVRYCIDNVSIIELGE